MGSGPSITRLESAVFRRIPLFQAAKLLGLSYVPTLRLSRLSEAERQAYVLADNKLALNAGWDQEILAIELQSLIDLEFDFGLTLDPSERNPQT